MREKVCVSEGECVYVCVCVRERERISVYVFERKIVCVYEREGQCVYVSVSVFCGCEWVFSHTFLSCSLLQAFSQHFEYKKIPLYLRKNLSYCTKISIF